MIPANPKLREAADFIVNQMEPMGIELPPTRTGQFATKKPVTSVEDAPTTQVSEPTTTTPAPPPASSAPAPVRRAADQGAGLTQLTPPPTKPSFVMPSKGRTGKVGDYTVRMSAKGDDITFEWRLPNRGKDKVSKEAFSPRRITVNWQDLPSNQYDMQQRSSARWTRCLPSNR